MGSLLIMTKEVEVVAEAQWKSLARPMVLPICCVHLFTSAFFCSLLFIHRQFP